MARPYVANAVGVECSCAQIYSAPNGARRSTSASVTINIAPLRGCPAERSITAELLVTQVPLTAHSFMSHPTSDF